MVMAQRLAVAMIARLRPPESRVTIIAIDRMPSSGSWNPRSCNVPTERNRSPISSLNSTSSASSSSDSPALTPICIRLLSRRRVPARGEAASLMRSPSAPAPCGGPAPR
jgi:hypothetical protein